jgi:hypothetical protein
MAFAQLSHQPDAERLSILKGANADGFRPSLPTAGSSTAHSTRALSRWAQAASSPPHLLVGAVLSALASTNALFGVLVALLPSRSWPRAT